MNLLHKMRELTELEGRIIYKPGTVKEYLHDIIYAHLHEDIPKEAIPFVSLEKAIKACQLRIRWAKKRYYHGFETAAAPILKVLKPRNRYSDEPSSKAVQTKKTRRQSKKGNRETT